MFNKYNKLSRMIALSCMLGFNVIQPIHSAVAYAADNTMSYYSKPISENNNKQLGLNDSYKSTAERRAEEAERQAKAKAEAEAAKARQEAENKAKLNNPSNANNANNSGLNNGMRSVDDVKEAARKAYEESLNKNGNNDISGNAGVTEKETQSMSTRIADKLGEKDAKVVMNIADTPSDNLYLEDAKELCKNNFDDKVCSNKELIELVATCYQSNMSGYSAGDSEAKLNASEKCTVLIKAYIENESKPPKEGFWELAKYYYENINEGYQKYMPEWVKFLAGDSLDEVGLTLLLTAATGGVGTALLKGGMWSLKAAKFAQKIPFVGKKIKLAEEMSEKIAKDSRFLEELEKTFGKDSEAVKQLKDRAFKDKLSTVFSNQRTRANELRNQTYRENLDAEAAQKIATTEKNLNKLGQEYGLSENAFSNLTKEMIESKVGIGTKIKDRVKDAAIEKATKVATKGTNVVGKYAIGRPLADVISSETSPEYKYDINKIKSAYSNPEFVEMATNKSNSDSNVSKISGELSRATTAEAEVNHAIQSVNNEFKENRIPINTISEAKAYESVMNKVSKTRQAHEITAEGYNKYIDTHKRSIVNDLMNEGITPEMIEKYAKKND